MDTNNRAVMEGKTALGIELGSTRIKAVLIDENHTLLASGNYDWENKLENGIFTYSMEDALQGLSACYSMLAKNVQEKYGTPLKTVGSIGISAMMHGYLPFDKSGNQLAQFRTWRNTTTEEAAKLLTKELGFNIPQRWSVAHVYQAILNGEKHVKDISFLTTLAGYIHYMLTGQKVAGVGEASGMFPIDASGKGFDKQMLDKFNSLAGKKGIGWKLENIMPKVLNAGENAGQLTEKGARLLDASGALQQGIPFCPPEGDAGTGMVATNSIKARTGNVSAGTSIFAMVVLEKPISKVYEEIDMVTTPAGKPVAMVHCNNCTSDLDAWIALMGEVSGLMGGNTSKPDLYTALYEKAMEAGAECEGLLAYNYLSGEQLTGLEKGRPMFMRLPEKKMRLAAFMRSHIYGAIATLKLGMDILMEQERVGLDELLGHGGFFKGQNVTQAIMASALNVPVSLMDMAAEGGAWGIAILALYAKKGKDEYTLEDYLSKKVFANTKSVCKMPDEKIKKEFLSYMESYKNCLVVQRAATEHFN